MWKSYYYIYLILTVLGMFILLPQLSSLNFAGWESIIESILLVLGTYSFVYKRSMFSKKIWASTFIVLLIIWFLQLIFYANSFPTITPMLSFLKTSYPQNYGELAFSIFLSIPALVAIYKIGFNKNKINIY